MLLGVGGDIRFFGGCGWRFRSYSGSLFQTPKSNQKAGPRRSAHSLKLGVPSFRDRSGGSAYGLLRCTSSRCVWLRQTVAALPPPDQSLHSACRRGQHGKIKSCSRANAHPVEWLEADAVCFCFCFSVGVSLLAKRPCLAKHISSCQSSRIRTQNRQPLSPDPADSLALAGRSAIKNEWSGLPWSVGSRELLFHSSRVVL
jgi:hypothetical protein